MADLTLLEATKLITNKQANQVANVFATSYAISALLPIETITGFTKPFTYVSSLPDSNPRDFGSDFQKTVGASDTYNIPWAIYGGVFAADRALKAGNPDAAAQGVIQQIQAEALRMAKDIFEGDGTSNTMTGIKKFIDDYYTGQVVNGSSSTANGDLLTLAMLDDLLNKILNPEAGDVALFMSKTVKNRLTKLLRDAGAGYPQTVDQFGNQIVTYAGIPVYTMENAHSGADVLSVTERDGANANDSTSSVYAVKFGDEGLKGFGPSAFLESLALEVGQNTEYRLEVRQGVAPVIPRCVARAKFIKEATA